MGKAAAVELVSPEAQTDIDLTQRYPLSMLYVVKKGLPWFAILLLTIAYIEWRPSGADQPAVTQRKYGV